ncbi:MAG: hypothetical protein M3280_05590 [Actinomycetota bacterium]|nr:hypothetical protein [Actinomycetota bacterium]
MGRWRHRDLLRDFLYRGQWDQDLQLIELQLWAVSAGASCWIVDLARYQISRVAGLVQKLSIDPVEGNLDAFISDGTGSVVARWGISRPAPQLVVLPGRVVVVEGLVVSGDEHMMMLDPAFELAPLPWVA